ncbi:DUF805 domain-containing protein [Staphylococcus sp. IVB6181]|uniref:DUF805 domain-containing protein n=1 Tax=Staphylococcus sp. IVB6181 TaxID=2929481 RepID=UPI0021CE8711|nr:DUF805 domain-containing protein [Staphylococcus sp. IVB6181]UXV35566.1 DUF805 domain-containing protein [Staphylococcus sp. IVB6181]
MEEQASKRVVFVEAFKLFLQNYFNFQGRSRRSEYWFWILWMLIFELVLGGIDGVLIAAKIVESGSGLSVVLIFELITLIPLFALTTRRFHDTGRNIVVPAIYFVVWLISLLIQLFFQGQVNVVIDRIIDIIMIIFGIYILVVSFLQSDKGQNKYGSEPVGQGYRKPSHQ